MHMHMHMHMHPTLEDRKANIVVVCELLIHGGSVAHSCRHELFC